MLIRRLKLLLQRGSAKKEEEANETNHLPDDIVVNEEKEEEAKVAKKAKVMSFHIPYDVVVEILLRLPAKSLIRFRCVCKDWYALISGDTFITTHTNRALSRSHDKNMSSVVVFRYPAGRHEMGTCHHFITLSDYGDKVVESEFRRFFPGRIVASCHGLFCTFDEDILPSGGYVLRNPFIYKDLKLPDPTIMPSASSGYKYDYGLGYDLYSSDIKLVRIVCLDPWQRLVEIYTLNSGCWRQLPVPSPYLIRSRVKSIFVNGASHWMAQNLDTCRNIILAFDMGDEVFREVALPECFAEDKFLDGILILEDLLDITLILRDGLLCVSRFYTRRQPSLSVWIMKEYGVAESWTKLFNIRMPSGLKRVVGFRKNGEVLVTSETWLHSYEPDAQRLTHVQFHPYSTAHLNYGFAESILLLLNVKNRVSK